MLTKMVKATGNKDCDDNDGDSGREVLNVKTIIIRSIIRGKATGPQAVNLHAYSMHSS